LFLSYLFDFGYISYFGSNSPFMRCAKHFVVSNFQTLCIINYLASVELNLFVTRKNSRLLTRPMNLRESQHFCHTGKILHPSLITLSLSWRCIYTGFTCDSMIGKPFLLKNKRKGIGKRKWIKLNLSRIVTDS